MSEHPAHNASLISIFSIIASMCVVAIGNGMMFAYIPFMLSTTDAPSWSAGAAVTASAAGGLIGCFITGPLIRRVGHARVFACSMALVVLSWVTVGFGLDPLAWIFARGLYGVAGNVNFIISQSWLNHAAANSWRGKAMSAFYMIYIFGLGLGAWVFGQMPVTGNVVPLIAVAFTAIAILPIGLTRLPNPPPPAHVSVDVKMAWRASPVGLVGVLAAGGLSMMVQGFAPIYAAGNGVGQQDVALLMFVMQFGIVFIQYPMGIVSDRIDRRLVLLLTAGLIVVVGLAALVVPFSHFVLLMLIFSIFAGSVETVYSIANAHANDRTAPEDFVSLSSTMLLAWSASAVFVPLLVTTLTPVLGEQTFIYGAILVAAAYGLFVVARVWVRAPVPASDAESFELMSAQVPHAGALIETAENEGKPAAAPGPQGER